MPEIPRPESFTYTEEQAEAFLEALVTMPIGIARIVKKVLPGRSTATVYSWRESHPEFAKRWDAAKVDRASLLMEDALDIADEVECSMGKGGANMVAKARLQTQIRQAHAKAYSREWRDRSINEHTGPEDKPLFTNLDALSTDELKSLRRLIHKASGEEV